MENLCITRWRKRAFWSARGLCPEAWRVKRAVWQVSQLRRRVPCGDALGLVDDVEAVAGGADRGAGAAAVAAEGDRRPRAGRSKCAGEPRRARSRVEARPARPRPPVQRGAARGRRRASAGAGAEALPRGPRPAPRPSRVTDLDGEAAVDRDEEEVRARASRPGPSADGAAEAGVVARRSRRARRWSSPRAGRTRARRGSPSPSPCRGPRRRRRRRAARRARPWGANVRRDRLERDVGLRLLPREERLGRREEELLQRAARQAAVEDERRRAARRGGSRASPSAARAGAMTRRPAPHEVGDERRQVELVCG